MGSMKTDGIEAFSNDLAALAHLPASVLANILYAEADVVLSAQRSEIESRWKGPYSLGISAKSVKKSRVKKGKDGYYISIYPQGSRKHGKKAIRNAEIAFINEYGAPKRDIRPRPALKDALDKKGDEAIAAGEKVYNKFLDSMNL